MSIVYKSQNFKGILVKEMESKTLTNCITSEVWAQMHFYKSRHSKPLKVS